MQFINEPLDDEERELMEMSENGDFRPLSEEEKEKIMAAVYAPAKDKAISLRINSQDLEEIKTKARNAGIPYQTLINTIIHRYISGGIVLKDPL